MKLLVGLGNPGRKYSRTRHNAGFMVIDELSRFLEFSVEKKKFSSFFGMTKIGGTDLCVVKPQTFMNLSGEAVLNFASYYKIAPKDIMIVHDDLDLKLGRIKFAVSAGPGGHNGIISVSAMLDTSEFWRLKVGIDRPCGEVDPADYVLSDFLKEEKKVFEKITKTSVEALRVFYEEGSTQAMNRFHSLVS